MPPENNEDYDAQLERCIRKLKNLQEDIEIEITLICSMKDIPEEADEQKKINPNKVYEDLKQAGFKM